MWHINNLYGVNAAHVAERVSVIALDNLERVTGRGKMILKKNRQALDTFLASRSDLEYHRPGFGPIIFLNPPRGRTDELYRLLSEKYETSVAPGSYFYMPDGFRVGIGGDPEMTREGLNRLGLALDKLRDRR